MLIDDRRSAVSLPETPLLAVLPGTGGITRVTDKRKVRRDYADFFCSTEEGIRVHRRRHSRPEGRAVAPRGRNRAEVEVERRGCSARERTRGEIRPPEGRQGRGADAARSQDRWRHHRLSACLGRNRAQPQAGDDHHSRS